MDALEILSVVPPLGWIAIAATFVAAIVMALEWVEREAHQARNRHSSSRWKELEGQLSVLNRQLDEQKSENQLLNQHVQFFVESLALDTFENDDARKRFIDAAGVFARNGDLKPLLEAKGLSAEELGAPSLGLTPQEAETLLALKSQWTVEGLVLIAERLRERLQAIAAMDAVWTNQNANADEHIRPILRENMWVFEPDFLTAEGRLWSDDTLDSLTHEINVESDEQARRRPDIVAEPVTDYSLQANHQWQKLGRRSTMVIDLKNAATQIRTAHQTQTWEYVRELIKRKAIPEHEPIDCYVIGGRVDEHEGGPRIEGWYQNVRIISCTYEQLIGRAKCLVLGLYDDLAPSAPVLQPGYGEEPEADGEGRSEPETPGDASTGASEPGMTADAGAAAHDGEEGSSSADAHDGGGHHDDSQHGDGGHDDGHHGDGHHEDEHHPGHDKDKQDGKHAQKPPSAPQHAAHAEGTAPAVPAEDTPSPTPASGTKPQPGKVPPVQGVTGKPAGKGGKATRVPA